MKSILERLRALEGELPQMVLVTLPGGKQAAVEALTAFEIAVHNGAATFSVPENPPMERLLRAVAAAVADDET